MNKNNKVCIFTICSKNYFPFARTLARSVVKFHPEADLILCVADTPASGQELNDFTQVIEAADLGIDDFVKLSFRYKVMELNTAVKPFMISRLFADGYRKVVYFDPDIVLFGRITEVLDRLDGGATTILTPHSLEPNEELDSPNDLTFLRAGAYNLGFMALRKCRETVSLVKWWGRRLETQCVSDRVDEGIFVDQKWMDLWPAYCPDVAILRAPGYNVAYWNLDHRKLAVTGDSWTVNGQPLVFFHFSGIVPGNRQILSKHQHRWSPSSSAAISKLFGEYHDALERNGNLPGADETYGYGHFSNGAPVPDVARIVFREALEPFKGNPFKSVPECLVEPSPDITPNPNGTVTRLMYHLWHKRVDLRSAFSLTTAASQIQFSNWFVEVGCHEVEIPDEFVTPVRARLAELSRLGGGKADAPNRSGFVSSLARSAVRLAGRSIIRATVPHMRPLYRHWKPERRRSLALWAVRLGRPASDIGEIHHVPHEAVVKSVGEPRAGSPLEPGMALIGYPFAEIGVGEALRALARSAEAADIPIDIYNFGNHVRARQNDRGLQHLVTDRLSKSVNVMCINADLAAAAIGELPSDAMVGRRNILRPFWELSIVPESLVPVLRNFDEIWAPTLFVRDAFSRVVDCPVVHMPVAVDFDVPADVDRKHLGLPERGFVFLFMFDMASYQARKNPEAVVEAFDLAFGDAPDADVCLVIKTMGSGAGRHESMARLKAMARTSPRVHVIDRIVDRVDAISLVAACDAFVSLHRSEGFGFGMAEAMFLGKPVIATDYSGNRDFLNTETGYPVAYDLIPVKEGEYPNYERGQEWANPDVRDAARHMLEVYENQESARSVGRMARKFIQEFHSLAAVGLQARKRLSELGAWT